MAETPEERAKREREQEVKTTKERQDKDVLEQLADKEHDSWARWMQWLFVNSQEHPDGAVTIPADLARRWRRQAATPYADLSEREKESDREEVRRILPLIEAALLKKQVAEAKEAGR